MIRRDAGAECFELVFIGGSRAFAALDLEYVLHDELTAAKVVILEDLTTPLNYRVIKSLSGRPDYVLAAHNADLRNGYSIFVRADAQCL